MTLLHKWEIVQMSVTFRRSIFIGQKSARLGFSIFVGGQGRGHCSLPYFAACALLSHTLFLSPATTSTDLFEGPQ